MELLRANCATELKWVRSVIEDLRSGKVDVEREVAAEDGEGVRQRYDE
jgi:hypothetical protein